MIKNIFQIMIIDHKTGKVKSVYNPQIVIDCSFSIALNSVSVAVVTLIYKKEYWENYGLDDFMEIYVDGGLGGGLVKFGTYLLRSREVFQESNIKQIAFSGVSLEHLLGRRLLKPTTDDNENGGGFITRAGKANDVIENIIKEQMIEPEDSNRKFVNLTVEKSGESLDVGIRERYKNVLEVILELVDRGSTDFYLQRTSLNNIVAKVGRRGSDKSYEGNFPLTYTSFSLNFGNVKNSSFSEVRNEEANYVYVLGEGEGVNQEVYPLIGFGSSDSLYNLIEFEDSKRGGESTSSTGEQVFTQAVSNLKNRAFVKEINVELISTRGYVFNEDFFIGDFVTVMFEGFRQKVRVTEVSIKIQKDGKTERKVTLKNETY